MALPDNDAIWNYELDIIQPAPATTWTQMGASWADAGNWNRLADELSWGADILDLGEVGWFNIEVQTEALGEVSYAVYVSSTGAFAGEETVTDIDPGDTNISAFYGRFVMVYTTVVNTSQLPELYYVSTRALNKTLQVRLNDVDTSTLSGTTAARTLVFPRNFSRIANMQITVQTLANFTLAVFATDHPNSNTLVPRIIDKSNATPRIALVGLDNVARDAVVDIVAEVYPEQFMSGNNLLFR